MSKSKIMPKPESRLQISADLAPRSRLVRSLLEAARKKERAEKIAVWQSILVPGECRVVVDKVTQAVTARRTGIGEADVSELLAPGSKIVRSRPNGDIEWSVRQLAEPTREGAPFRVLVENEQGGRVNFVITELMAPPDERGRSWILPIPEK